MIKHMEQVCIEDTYSRKNIREAVIRDIQGGDKRFEYRYERLVAHIIELATGDYYESKMKRMYILKQVDPKKIASEILISVFTHEKTVIQTIASEVFRNIKMKGNLFEGIRTIAECIYAGSKSKIYDVEKATNTDTMMVYNTYTVDDSTYNLIMKTKYLPPMIVKPKVLTDNMSCGYLSIDKDSLILGKGNNHNKPINLDVLNKMNQVAYTIDGRITELEEVSKKELGTREKRLNFEEMVSQSKIVYRDLIKTGNKFYFTHKIDKRGRYYCQGYSVNYQGNSYRKAMIMLHKQEVINDSL